MSPEEFRRAGHQIVDFIADYRARVVERPVMARTAPGEVRAALPTVPPDDPEPFDALLQDLDRIVLPGLTHWQHPRFFGYFPLNSLLSSVLGDYVSTGLGVLGLAWQSSPALTEVEHRREGLFVEARVSDPSADGRTIVLVTSPLQAARSSARALTSRGRRSRVR